MEASIVFSTYGPGHVDMHLKENKVGPPPHTIDNN